MNRVLIITYYWPPTGGSGVQRWVKFSKYLPAQGWQPVIYTPENPEMLVRDDSLLADIPPEAEVVKRRIVEPYGLYRRLVGAGAAGSEKNEINPLNSGEKNWKQKLSLFVRSHFFVPDPRVGWVRPSVRFLKKYLKEHPVDVIVSTGPPHSIHLIGKGVSEATGIPWVADFRDPWTRVFYFKNLELSPKAALEHSRLEQEVLDKARAVIAVTPLVQKDFQMCTGTQVEMITNGYDEDDFAAVEAAPDGYFNITHTGLFASDGIPTTLWKVLSQMCSADSDFAEELRIRLVGKVDKEVLDSLKTYGLAGNVVPLGYLDHKEAVREQKSASMLILPLRKDPEYRKTLPGKIFEYLASDRPVLGIGQEDGVAAQVLTDTGAGEMFDWDNEAGIAAVINRAWMRHKSGSFPFHTVGREGYSRRVLTQHLVDLLEKIK